MIILDVTAAILTAIVVNPMHDAVLLQNPDVALWANVAATGIISAVAVPTLSALVSLLREVVPLLKPVILASLLFTRSLVAVVGKWCFQQTFWFIPAQWGFSASAFTVDLRKVDSVATKALLWTSAIRAGDCSAKSYLMAFGVSCS
ncbi:hypothetical protein [Mycobacterium lepromatosis]|uniref:hypothetical protein n=1 Tax=Mycobacterium lepromatosis TaxID=480418 RepID=UPI000678B8D4|nr:hypothetical protein [Mycobacterium lepromatosis]